MRIAIADDSLIIREGLTKLLDGLGHEVVVRVDRPDRILAEVAAHRPDVVVVDIKMPPTFTDEGLRAAGAIRQRHADVGALVLSQYVVASYATWLLEMAPGSIGYLLKNRILDPAILQDALSRIHAGETVVDPELVQVLIRSRAEPGPLTPLSRRELDVLALIAEGLSDRGIAERLVISLSTVSSHVQHIFTKLGIPDTATDNRRVHAVLRWLESPAKLE
ncbi:response regulator transcription factor [Streptosporangiaceae bacterium NEAU-GS5]|nr:response regulator transcription factor [Streptosporangiaceae bacterium NEAU-GS5]